MLAAHERRPPAHSSALLWEAGQPGFLACEWTIIFGLSDLQSRVSGGISNSFSLRLQPNALNAAPQATSPFAVTAAFLASYSAGRSGGRDWR